MSIPEIQAELLRGEYPFLRPDHDPDIERYFDFRTAGRSADALALYRARLMPRYPDDAFRARVLRAYRLREPLYAALLEKAYAVLGGRLLERTKRIIKYIAVRAEAYDPADAYSTIKAAESILAMLPKERFEAVAAMERFFRYAQRLEYCVPALERADALVRAYVTETLSVLEDERRRLEERKRQARDQERRMLVERDKTEFEEERRRYLAAAARTAAPERRPGPRSSAPVPSVLDLSSIRFSAADLSRIQIPPTLAKVEDQTLAYCFKYWNLVNDDAFERVLFLYSRKFGTKQYDVFSAVRRGRMGGKRDDEILSAVMAILITGYYYSIRGDVYLQRNWTLLKAKLEKQTAPGAFSSAVRRVPAVRRRPPAVRKPAGPPAPAIGASAVSAGAPAAAAVAPRGVSAPTAAPQEPAGPAAAGKTGGGSVSDRLRRLSGRSYDVYRDLFLAKARPAIRKILGRDKGLFHTVPVEAENLVYEFLRDHYTDPYMDWADSEAKSKLASQGYHLESVDEVIEECYRGMAR